MKLRVPTLAKKEGETVTFEKVLLVDNEKEGIKVGTPYLKGSSVEAKVLGNGRGKKIRVFKMKHRKRYRRTQGHRQGYTEIEVTRIKG